MAWSTVHANWFYDNSESLLAETLSQHENLRSFRLLLKTVTFGLYTYLKFNGKVARKFRRPCIETAGKELLVRSWIKLKERQKKKIKNLNFSFAGLYLFDQEDKGPQKFVF
jgi:hypothetical protein